MDRGLSTAVAKEQRHYTVWKPTLLPNLGATWSEWATDYYSPCFFLGEAKIGPHFDVRIQRSRSTARCKSVVA